MSRHRRSQGRLGRILRRVFMGPPEELDYPDDSPRYAGLHMEPYDLPEFTPPLPSPLDNRLPDPILEAEGYLREYIHPIVGDHPFDLDETSFDLIRAHPYLPPGTVIAVNRDLMLGNPFRERGNDGDDRPARQMDTPPDGGHDSGSGGLRLRPVVHPRLLLGGDASPERSIPEDVPADRGLDHVRGWFDNAPSRPEGDQPPAAAGGPRAGGYRNPGH